MSSQYDTDRALVARLLDRDEVACAEFFLLMFPRVYRFALARVGRRENVAEAIPSAEARLSSQA